MRDFVKIFNNLNPLKSFTENCKADRNLAKPISINKLTPVRFSPAVKLINNIFDDFNNIYYYFLLSEVAFESYPGKKLNKKYFATNQLTWHFFIYYCFLLSGAVIESHPGK